MKKKKTAKAEKQAAASESTRDLVIANRISGRVHGGLSRIRLSLTFRIALHYCLQLLRSFIPVFLILSILFCFAVSVPVGEKIRDLTSLALSHEETDRESEQLSVHRTEETSEKALFPRIGQQTKLIFTNKLLQNQLWFYYTDSGGREWKVCVILNEIIRLWSFLGAGVFIADLLRMLYFFRHDQRINKRVLAPIRDITAMAATLSENNLSNRINIAGTKNELKDLAHVINRMLDRIERSYNSQKQFVSDASHELRTPIAVIRGYTDMLKRWGKDDPEILDEGITAISQETEGMKDLVESLLFLARHDKKTLMMEKTVFDVSELLEEIQKEEQMVHTEYVFCLEETEPLSINADRNMIKQVLRILCDNAVKYSEPNTSITLSVKQEGSGCCVTVKDQGQGISPEDLPHIFDRFYRSDKARKSETGGHGLGLSIARIIILAHDGKIRVRSKQASGTEFSVLLPEK